MLQINNMVFINNLIDVTMSPPSSHVPVPPVSVYTSSFNTFEQAARKNHIYKGNGAICQKKMCGTLTGCETPFGCPGHPDWARIQEFCGPYGTPAVFQGGVFLATNVTPQALLQATEQKKAQFSPYNLPNMYN